MQTVRFGGKATPPKYNYIRAVSEDELACMIIPDPKGMRLSRMLYANACWVRSIGIADARHIGGDSVASRVDYITKMYYETLPEGVSSLSPLSEYAILFTAFSSMTLPENITSNHPNSDLIKKLPFGLLGLDGNERFNPSLRSVQVVPNPESLSPACQGSLYAMSGANAASNAYSPPDEDDRHDGGHFEQEGAARGELDSTIAPDAADQYDTVTDVPTREGAEDAFYSTAPPASTRVAAAPVVARTAQPVRDDVPTLSEIENALLSDIVGEPTARVPIAPYENYKNLTSLGNQLSKLLNIDSSKKESAPLRKAPNSDLVADEIVRRLQMAYHQPTTGRGWEPIVWTVLSNIPGKVDDNRISARAHLDGIAPLNKGDVIAWAGKYGHSVRSAVHKARSHFPNDLVSACEASHLAVKRAYIAKTGTAGGSTA